MFDEEIPQKVRNLVERRNIISLSHDLLKSSFKNLKAHIIQLQDTCYFLPKDFGYRHKLQLLTDIAIMVGDIKNIDNHRIMIKIKDHKIEIQGDKGYQLQIRSIFQIMTTMLTKDKQDELKKEELKYINILSKAQYQQIVHRWNKTDKSYPKDKTIHALFEEQVKKTPNNIAVIFEDKILTYKELNGKANQLAHYLQDSYKIKPDDLITLCLDRSEQMIIAIFGVLKSGGGYVPIDPGYPDARIRYILNL